MDAYYKKKILQTFSQLCRIKILLIFDVRKNVTNKLIIHNWSFPKLNILPMESNVLSVTNDFV